MPRKTASLSVHWKTEGSPPVSLQDLWPDNPLQGTSALVHWADCDTDKVLEEVKPIVRESSRCTLTVSPLAFSATEKLKKSKKKVVEDVYSLCKKNFVMELGAKCEDYIVVCTGEGFRPLNKERRNTSICEQLKEHPMMRDVSGLSKMALTSFGCSGNFETVITKANAIYVALLYLNDTPAYYVGKADNGIKKRWHTTGSSHGKSVNEIIRHFESAPGAFEEVVHHQQCHLAIAGAVLKQVATRSADGVAVVAVFAVDFSPTGTIRCCNPDHNECKKAPDAIDHFEQHYMNAFKELFPDSDTEPKMMCLNAIKSTKCHDCSAGNLRGCSVEVALSLLLHDLRLS